MNTRNPATLPEGYEELFQMNLQKDKKTALLINAMAIVIMLLFGLLGHFCVVPFQTLFDMEQGVGIYFLRLGVLIVGYVVYIVLHEAVHGVCMWHFSKVKPKYGFTGMYAFAGSTAYFCKSCYIVIALAPIVVWGVVLAVLCAVVPGSWFWVVYFIQIGNLAGAAGDLYVTWRLGKLPADILVNDTGVDMTVYGNQKTCGMIKGYAS